jgi:hypothetical protein
VVVVVVVVAVALVVGVNCGVGNDDVCVGASGDRNAY